MAKHHHKLPSPSGSHNILHTKHGNIPRGTPYQGHRMQGVRRTRDFRPISRFISEMAGYKTAIVTNLLWSSNRKPYPSFWIVPCSATLSDLRWLSEIFNDKKLVSLRPCFGSLRPFIYTVYRPIYVTDLYAFVITNQQSASHSVIHITVVVFAVDWCTLARLSTIYLSSQSQQPATVSRFVGHLGVITHDKTWPVGTDEAGQWNWLLWWGLKQVLNGDDLVRALVLGILIIFIHHKNGR